VCFVDEASVLFDGDIGAQEYATDLARMGRKVGLGLVAGGTDFKADTLPTSARGNFGGRIAFHFDEPSLSRSLIRSTQAVNLRQRGRALALLPGRILTELQAPIVTTWGDLPAKRDVIELAPVTSAPDKDQDADPDQADKIRELHQAGKSQNEIQRAIFGYTGGAAYEAVKAVLASTTTTQADDTADTDPIDSSDSSSSTVDWCEYCQDTRADDPHKRFFACQGCGVAV
jgi:DNA segregation ATPase FtsK/SpoIIIE-like protein